MTPSVVERRIRAAIDRASARWPLASPKRPGSKGENAPRSVRARLVRDAILVATGGLLVFAAWETIWLWGYIDSQRALGVDLTFYQEAARRWLQGRPLYGPDQLAGPYLSRTLVDFLYPPPALYLFAAFLILPNLLWWAIPIGLLGLVLVRLRPAPWTWPLLAACVTYPTTLSAGLYGNSDLWVMAAVAAGILWAWPGVLVVLKPSLLFLAALGARHRTWWIAGGVLLLMSVPFGALWADYLRAMLNLRDSWTRSLGDLPLVTIPLIAALGRRDRASPAHVVLTWVRPSRAGH